MKKSNYRLYLASFSLVMIALPAAAANRYVRIGASGNGSGSDWANACPGFSESCSPSSLVRGDTYYIAAGNYPAVSFSTPDSGTALITLKKATVAEHGTSTGWNNNYGTAAANFTRNIGFSTNYWVLDGATGGGPGSWTAGFGMVINTKGNHGTCISEGGGGRGYHHLTFRHIECIGDQGAPDTNSNNYCTFFGIGPGPVLLEYFYCHDVTGVMVYNRSNALTVQYSWFQNIATNPGTHAEGLFSDTGAPGKEGITRNITVRYTVWKDVGPESDPSGITGILVCQCDGYEVYGNVFWNGGGGQGAVTTWNYAYNAKIYNNTFVDCNKGVNFRIGETFGNIVAYNNLFYNTPAEFSADPGVSIVHDYSWCGPESGTACTNEANDQNAGSTNPFVSVNMGDFRLTAKTAAGLPMGSPFDMDPLGILRSAGGWDRGAYQFGGTAARPNPPTNVTNTAR